MAEFQLSGKMISTVSFQQSEHVPLTVSHYYTYHTSIVATGKEGIF